MKDISIIRYKIALERLKRLSLKAPKVVAEDLLIVISEAEAHSLKSIYDAPKDGSYIILLGPSGYTTTPMRAEVGHYDSEYRPLNPWQTHSNDAFTDGGDEPTHWIHIPQYEL